MWTKEKIKSNILKKLTQDIVITNWSYFHSNKYIISGYCHINRLGLVKRIESQFASTKWNIKFNLINITGTMTNNIINKLIEIIPPIEIESIFFDETNKLIEIKFRKEPHLNILKSLDIYQEKIKDSIILIMPKSELKKSLKTYVKSLKSAEKSKLTNNEKNVLENKILSNLPSWVLKPEISQINEDTIQIAIKNDLKDGERLNFLKILLESQLGYKIDISQVFTFNDQIKYLNEIVSSFLSNYNAIRISDDSGGINVRLNYDDFPISNELEKQISSDVLKKTMLHIIEFHSTFIENVDKICLNIKEWILKYYSLLEYCFVYFSKETRNFFALIPEENALNITLKDIKTSIENESDFKYKISVYWIEEKPEIYLSRRIFINKADKSNLVKIDYTEDKKQINIVLKEGYPSENIWRKILFRLTRFQVSFENSKSNNQKDIFSFTNYLENLDIDVISDLVVKYLPESLKIHSIFFDEKTEFYIVKYFNLLLHQNIKFLKHDLEDKFQIKIKFISTRNSEELISTLKENIPDWILFPQITLASSNILKITAQNDFDDEIKIKKFVTNESKNILVPINYEIILSVPRIKQIITEKFGDIIEIERLKIYPDKKSIYLEAKFKNNQLQEEDLEDLIVSLESKTQYSIEAYLKKKSPLIQRQSVHDILEKLKNNYEFMDSFSDTVIKNAEETEEFSIENAVGRIDLRDLDCFSIDPKGTKAIDDCISIQRLKSSSGTADEILVGIHIADVSFFVPKDSEIDKEAKRRGYTVYLPHEKKILHLFPDKIIKISSLIEGHDRPALSLFIRLNIDLNIEDFFIKETIIKNKKQYSNYEANELLLEQKKSDHLTDLQLLVSITSQFRYNRINRGSINLDSAPDNISDLIVTELMIMSNRLMALHIQSLTSGQKLFRNQSIKSYTFPILQQKLKSFGYHLDLINKNPLTDINRIINESIIKGDSVLIIQELRKHLSNAYYSHTCSGHESLGSKWYTQWTSPLRKYMDLIVQRLVRNEYIQDLHYMCQYQSALERLIKIKLENFESDYIINYVNQLKEKSDLSLSLDNFNRKRALFSSSFRFLVSIWFENKENISIIDENKIKIFNQTLELNESININIIEVYKEGRDFYINFNLFQIPSQDSNQAIYEKNNSEHNVSVQGKIIYLNDR